MSFIIESSNSSAVKTVPSTLDEAASGDDTNVDFGKSSSNQQPSQQREQPRLPRPTRTSPPPPKPPKPLKLTKCHSSDHQLQHILLNSPKYQPHEHNQINHALQQQQSRPQHQHQHKHHHHHHHSHHSSHQLQLPPNQLSSPQQQQQQGQQIDSCNLMPSLDYGVSPPLPPKPKTLLHIKPQQQQQQQYHLLQQQQLLQQKLQKQLQQQLQHVLKPQQLGETEQLQQQHHSNNVPQQTPKPPKPPSSPEPPSSPLTPKSPLPSPSLHEFQSTKQDALQTQTLQFHHFRHHKSAPTFDLFFKSPTSSSCATPLSKSRRNSSYHSYDDLDATSAEKKVVSSLKYLCACTGATLRNLSKKTKDLHAKNYCHTKPTWRLWGEEHEKNAIFTVYLKKVRYHRPTPTANNDSDDEISHLEWETVRVRFVKAATLARLVEALATDDGELESTFINVFLSTYRTFSTPKEVLNLLIRRYDTLNDKHLQEIEEHQQLEDVSYDPATSIHEQHKKTLVSALHVWLDGFPEDWNEDNLRQILTFASKRLPRSDLHVKVLHRLERILRQQVYGENSLPPWLASGVGGNTNGNNMNMSLSVGLLPQHYNTEFTDQFAGLCLAPAFRGPTHFLQAFRFPHVPVRHFAEQLTRMDSELFKRLIPHQCLGATWARRDKSGSETVVATINQFNAVLFRVISSILIEPRLKPQERALNIATWIDIAQELRLLKNFSSLKAIISGLQSNPIYRLSKIWAVLPKEKMEIFNELARIFSEDNNAWAQREVLMREGTAKFADTVGEHDRHLQKIIQKQSTQTSHGTIPYLGTFLTDLTMIHAAIPDTIGEHQLINFDKKRKEFEVLAQIKLLQGAANTYNLREDPNFDRWFASMLVLDEREAHTLSCQLESPPPAPRKSTASTNTSLTNTTISSNSMGGVGGNGHRKTDSIASNSSSGAGSQFYCELNNSYSSHYSSRHNSLDRDAQAPNASLLSASSSVSNLSMDSSNSGGQKSNTKMTHSHSTNGVRGSTGSGHNNSQLNVGSPIINAQLVQSPGVKTNNAPDFYIIRVTYETENVELDGIVLYKSIMLGNNERTPQVIRNAMMKLGLEADPEQYTLAQVLPDKELVMPKNANVYYAVNTNYNLNFILRPKKKDGGSNGS
ncbi:ral guanine nucleotide dissociation stimulator-like 1 isoform X1 [Anastrepha obliqua]|uniref:ral guanine nucleotide dissociation stimulator-like 1 isoform X1 n=1 Tax=Anastrepha obliqua TaxID=95512 RepID=UPI00240A1E61|nr:ral guanine nucleotide dissociation stimulator-like 1 isoform X1 [Anastrepha obliqua]